MSSSAGERAVPLVQMDHPRHDSQGAQRAHSPDAEQEFLPDPHPLIAAVEAGRQLAILRLIAVNVRIEQQQRIASHSQLPDAGDDLGAASF